jgi:hypothetical protein
MKQFYIASLKWTKRDSLYITFWRPNDSRYAWPLSWSGKYAEDDVRNGLAYYNDGASTIAVPVEVVDPLGVPPAPGHIDNDAGPVVLNTRDNWKLLLENVILEPHCAPQPQYKGAPRRKKEASCR